MFTWACEPEKITKVIWCPVAPEKNIKKYQSYCRYNHDVFLLFLNYMYTPTPLPLNQSFFCCSP